MVLLWFFPCFPFSVSALGRKWSIAVAESAFRNARREQAQRAAAIEIETYVTQLSEIEAVDAYVALTTHYDSALVSGEKYVDRVVFLFQEKEDDMMVYPA